MALRFHAQIAQVGEARAEDEPELVGVQPLRNVGVLEDFRQLGDGHVRPHRVERAVLEHEAEHVAVHRQLHDRDAHLRGLLAVAFGERLQHFDVELAVDVGAQFLVAQQFAERHLLFDGEVLDDGVEEFALIVEPPEQQPDDLGLLDAAGGRALDFVLALLDVLVGGALEGEAALVGGGQEGDAANFAQVHSHGVVNDVALDVVLLRVGYGLFGLLLGRRDLFGVGLLRNVVGRRGLRERGRQGVGVALGGVRRGDVGRGVKRGVRDRGFLGLDGGGRGLSGGALALRPLRLFRGGLRCLRRGLRRFRGRLGFRRRRFRRFRGGFGRARRALRCGLGRRGLGRRLGAGLRRALRRLRLLDVVRCGRLFRGQRCILLSSA